MAPSSGTLVVPVAMRLLRQALQKTQAVIRARLPEQSTKFHGGELQPVLVRNPPRHPLHRVAALRQSKGRWYSTHSSLNATIRRFTSSAVRSSSIRLPRASLPSSAIGTTVNRLTTRAPFASTLRPNLTGGAFPRTAGGYSTGGGRLSGGVRHFSHTPAAPAQVVQNVSTAVRAFLLSGQKAQFDGVDPRTGRSGYKAVSNLQSAASQKLRTLPKSSPGTSIDFTVSPTITALSPSIPTSHQESGNLNSEGLLDVLSADFARALKDLSAVLSDLNRLSSLGDLPVTMTDDATLRIHFPGCDYSTVERLCLEFNVQRGVIRQDDDFDESAGTDIALLFPFAPSRSASDGDAEHVTRDKVEWRTMLSSPGYSHCSQTGTGLIFEKTGTHREDISSLEDYASMHPSDICTSDRESDFGAMYFRPSSMTMKTPMRSTTSAEYEGLAGIHRFLRECDGARELF